MNIINTFIKLTKRTYPHGHEEELSGFLPDGYLVDEYGNYLYKIGESKTIFACHLDTASKDQKRVKHIFDGKIIKTDGKTILGADDKAGMTVLLYMIEKNVPGLYYFFIGEEVGCIGSTAASANKDFFKNYDRIVSFDRRGTGSIITHQSSKRSCSDKFADELSKEFAKSKLLLEKDNTGVYTDSAEFVTIIPECTNISVGYYKEHTHDESQDIEFLQNLCKAVIRVDWENLPTERDPSKTEYRSYSRGYNPDYDYEGYGSYSGYGNGYSYYGGERNWGNRNTSYHSSGKNRSYDSYDMIYDAATRSYNRKEKKPKSEVDNFFSDEEFYNRQFLNDLDTPLKGSDGKYTIDLRSATIINQNDSKTDYYRGVRKMFLDDSLSLGELEIIKSQCLDMKDSADVDFYNSMKKSLSDELPFGF